LLPVATYAVFLATPPVCARFLRAAQAGREKPRTLQNSSPAMENSGNARPACPALLCTLPHSRRDSGRAQRFRKFAPPSRQRSFVSSRRPRLGFLPSTPSRRCRPLCPRTPLLLISPQRLQ